MKKTTKLAITDFVVYLLFGITTALLFLWWYYTHIIWIFILVGLSISFVRSAALKFRRIKDREKGLIIPPKSKE